MCKKGANYYEYLLFILCTMYIRYNGVYNVLLIKQTALKTRTVNIFAKNIHRVHTVPWFILTHCAGNQQRHHQIYTLAM